MISTRALTQVGLEHQERERTRQQRDAESAALVAKTSEAARQADAADENATAAVGPPKLNLLGAAAQS